MSDTDLARVIYKQQRLKALHRARARVQQLERELRGEPVNAEEPPSIPDFLRKRVAGELVTTPVSKPNESEPSEGLLTLEDARERRRRA